MGQSQHRTSKNKALQPASDADIQAERVVKLGPGARRHNKDPGGVERAMETSGVDFFSPADRNVVHLSLKETEKAWHSATERPWPYEIMSADV